MEGKATYRRHITFLGILLCVAGHPLFRISTVDLKMNLSKSILGITFCIYLFVIYAPKIYYQVKMCVFNIDQNIVKLIYIIKNIFLEYVHM